MARTLQLFLVLVGLAWVFWWLFSSDSADITPEVMSAPSLHKVTQEREGITPEPREVKAEEVSPAALTPQTVQKETDTVTPNCNDTVYFERERFRELDFEAGLPKFEFPISRAGVKEAIES